MTTADYLNQLEQDRQDLVDNLETKGITGLSGDETFTELVPEVLNIPSGGGGVLPTNLRHIQVGDNLYNKKIYFNFPSNLYTLTKAYHESFGDTGIKHRIFIATTNNVSNPYNFGDYSTGYPIFSTYYNSNNVNLGIVNIFYASRSYISLYNSSTTDGCNYLGMDLSMFPEYNINADIEYIDTNNPAYQYVWIEDEV